MGASVARRTQFRSLRASNSLSCRSLAHWQSCRTGASGLDFEDEQTLDPSLRPALVRFDGVEPTAVLDDATHVENLAAVGGILACAEAVGAAAAVLDLAREYAAQRRQFGHTIASFQALRHLLADMHVQVESSWSSVLYAAASLDEAEMDALADRVDREGVHGAGDAGGRPRRTSGFRRDRLHRGTSCAPLPPADHRSRWAVRHRRRP